MNKRWRSVCAALAVWCASLPAQAAGASEEQWIAAARHAVAFGQAHGLDIVLAVEHGPGLSGHTPIGVWNENGRCTIVVSVRDNPTARRLEALVEPALLALFLKGAAMHEVGHCYRRLNGYPHNEQLLPVVSWIGPVQNWFTRRLRTEEVFADMTEVAWLARYHPAQYDAMLAQIQRVRRHFLKPKHDTLAWLEGARRDGPLDAEGTIFAVAKARMMKY